MDKKEVIVEKKAPAYTREQLARSQRFEKHRDAVMAVLAEGELYTMAEADEKLKAFMKRKVD